MTIYGWSSSSKRQHCARVAGGCSEAITTGAQCCCGNDSVAPALFGALNERAFVAWRSLSEAH